MAGDKNKKTKESVKVPSKSVELENDDMSIQDIDMRIRQIIGLGNSIDELSDVDIDDSDDIDRSKKLQQLLKDYKAITGQEWQEDVYISTMQDELKDMTDNTENTNNTEKVYSRLEKKLFDIDKVLRQIDKESDDYQKLKKEFAKTAGFDWYDGISHDVISDNVEKIKVLQTELENRGVDVEVITGDGVATAMVKNIDADVVTTEEAIQPQAKELAEKTKEQIQNVVESGLSREDFEKELLKSWNNGIVRAVGVLDRKLPEDILYSTDFQKQFQVALDVFIKKYPNLDKDIIDIKDKDFVVYQNAFFNAAKEYINTLSDKEVGAMRSAIQDAVLSDADKSKSDKTEPEAKAKKKTIFSSKAKTKILGSFGPDGKVVTSYRPGDQKIIYEKNNKKSESVSKEIDNNEEKFVVVLEQAEQELENFKQELDSLNSAGKLLPSEKDQYVIYAEQALAELRQYNGDEADEAYDKFLKEIELRRDQLELNKNLDKETSIETENNKEIEETPELEQRLDELRSTNFYDIHKQTILNSLRENPSFSENKDVIQSMLSIFKQEILDDINQGVEWSVADLKKHAEKLAYFEILLGREVDSDESRETEDNGLELASVELNLSDIENVFNENPELINELKALLAGREGGGSESLKGAIQEVLQKHFRDILSPEQFKSVEGQIAEISSLATEQIVKAYNDSLDIRAKDEVGFFKKMFSKITGKRMIKMAATILAGIGGAALAGFVAPAGLLAGGAIAMGGSFAGRTGFSIFMRRFGSSKKGVDKELAHLEEKEQENIQKAKEKIINEGYKIKTGKDEKRVELFTVESLAASVRNAVRMETSHKLHNLDDVMDAEGRVSREAAKVLFDNINDIVYHNTAKRLEIEYNLRQKLASEGKNYDEMSKADQDKLLEEALAREAKFLFEKYSMELIGKLEMEEMMYKAKESGAIKVIQKVQNAMSGNIVELGGRKRSDSVKEDVAHVAGASAVGMTLYYAYQHSSILAGVSTATTGAMMAHEYGKSKEQKAIAEAYMDEMKLILSDAEKKLNNAITGGEDNWGQVDVAAKRIQGLLSMTRPRSNKEAPLVNFIDDPVLRNAGIDFLDRYNRAKLESGEAKAMTSEDKFEEAMAVLQDQINITREDVIGHIDSRIADVVKHQRKITALYTTLGGVAGYIAGHALRTVLHHDKPEHTSDHTTHNGTVDNHTPSDPKEIDNGTVDHLKSKPIIKDNIWNTIEANLKHSSAYKAIIEYAMEKGGHKVDLSSLSAEQLDKLDLDQFALGTTAIDKLKDELVQSFAKGDASYLRADLSADQLHSLGFDNLQNIDPNHLTPEQMQAIDWEKVLHGDKDLNILETAKALQVNNNDEAMKHILSHNEALQDLAEKGKIDWGKDFDATAENYEAWQHANPGKSVDDYLHHIKEATTQASGAENIANNSAVDATADNNDNSAVDAGATVKHTGNISESNETISNNLDKHTSPDENSSSDQVADSSNTPYEQDLENLVKTRAGIGDFQELFTKALHIDTAKAQVFALWIGRDSSVADVLNDGHADKLTELYDEFDKIAHSHTMPSKGEWTPRIIAYHADGTNETMLTRLSSDGQFVETKGVDITDSFPDNKIPADEFKTMLNKAAGVDTTDYNADIDNTNLAEGNTVDTDTNQATPASETDVNKASDDIFADEKLSTDSDDADTDNSEAGDISDKGEIRLSGQDVMKANTMSRDIYDKWNDGAFANKEEFLDAVKDKLGHLDDTEKQRWSQVWDKNNDVIENGPVNQNIMVKNTLDLMFAREIGEDLVNSGVSEHIVLPDVVSENMPELNKFINYWADLFSKNDEQVKLLSSLTKFDIAKVKEGLDILSNEPNLINQVDRMGADLKILTTAILKAVDPKDLEATAGAEELVNLLSNSKIK